MEEAFNLVIVHAMVRISEDWNAVENLSTPRPVEKILVPVGTFADFLCLKVKFWESGRGKLIVHVHTYVCMYNEG